MKGSHSGHSEGLTWCAGELVKEGVEGPVPEACPCPIPQGTGNCLHIMGLDAPEGDDGDASSETINKAVE